MNNEFQKKHLHFNKTNIERPRRKRKGAGKPPPRDNVEYGTELIEKVAVLQDAFNEQAPQKPPEFDPAFIFRLKLDSLIGEDEWRRSGLTLLSEEPDQVVVLFSEDQLAEFKDRVDQYRQEIPDGKKGPTYSWIASVTENMALWGANDRIGEKLRNIDIKTENEYRIDVELWSYGDADSNRVRHSQLKEFIENNDGAFLDSYIDSSINISRVKVTGDILEKLLNVDIVQTVDLPPEPSFNVIELINTGLDEFNTPIPAPPDGSTGICIIDSGINRGHPMLGPATGFTRACPDSLGDGLDQNGHGTMVAGIALFGDVASCIDSLNFEPQLFLYSAQVTNENNQFDDDRLIVSQMYEAITYYHEEYACRIFNISLGDPRLVYGGGKPSPWAYILDHLARELDIVIIVPTGNIECIPSSTETANKIKDTYPAYLLADESKIIEPATASNVITVGSLAHSDTIYAAARNPNDPAIQIISTRNQLSPFTRSGPGVNSAIKPDVCEYGGSVIWDGRPSPRIITDTQQSIVSMSHKHLERLFAIDIGTSFAAPKVAHLAGLILNNYPGISANLIRALIASSATVPDVMEHTLDEEETILNTYGYGLVDFDRALYSTDNRVTLIAEESITVDKLHLFEIPIPDEFKQTNGLRRISITLAFDPPVKHTRKNYLEITMDFRLFRGLETGQIIDQYAERPEDFDPDRIGEKYICSYRPPMTKISRGTLQKGVWQAQRNAAFTSYQGDMFHLMVRCKKASWSTLDEDFMQNYGLVVTLEHVTETIQLYQTIQQRIRVQQRVRAVA